MGKVEDFFIVMSIFCILILRLRVVKMIMSNGYLMNIIK